MITTTLNAIKAHGPCASGWSTLLKSLNKSGPDDEPLPLAHILQSNGIDDAIWSLRSLDESHRKTINLMAYRFANLARPYMKDQRSIDALDVVYRFINGEATREELRDAAARAVRAARAARAAYAADAAAYAAYAADAAAYAADAAAYAARAAAYAARAAIREDVKRIFLEFVD